MEVSPANNELNVPINRGVSIRFAVDVDVSTATDGTLLLHEVNGNAIPCTVTYVRTTRTANIQPDSPLLAGTTYRATVLGGENGVKTITGGTLPATKTYEFTTTGQVLITAPTNLVTSIVGNKVTINWLQPDQYDQLDVPKYEAYVSTSNLDPETNPGAIVWPLATDSIDKIAQTSIAVGKALDTGNYYIYVRGITESQNGAWASTQIYIAPQTDVGGGSTPGGGGGGTFEIHETYPKQDAVHVMPQKLIVLFTAPIDMSTVNAQTVYILKKKKPNQLSIIDLMTEYGPNNTISYSIDANTSANLLSLTLPADILDSNSEYTVVIREGIKSTSGDALGEAYSWSFTTTYDPLFGDPEEIRNDVAGFLSRVTDKVLYSYMSNISQLAYETVQRVQGDSFNAETFLADVPRYMGQYVRVRATYDLLSNAMLERASSAGTVRTLGDLTIDNSKAADISSTLSAFKARIKPWEDELYGLHDRGYAKPSYAVKGETGAAYPEHFTRDFKDTEA